MASPKAGSINGLIGEDEGQRGTIIDPVSSTVGISDLIGSEAFMAEDVTVYVHESTDENSPNHFVLNVNGVNQPVIRGTASTIKRKYLEVLARMKETKYTQRQVNPHEPDKRELVPRTANVYPFDLVEDRNPKGRAWLNHILKQVEA